MHQLDRFHLSKYLIITIMPENANIEITVLLVICILHLFLDSKALLINNNYYIIISIRSYRTIIDKIINWGGVVVFIIFENLIN